MPYAGQRIALTTLHGKQTALARPFALGLGANLACIACDTNALGTFSGEVARIDDALSTCQRKAWMGMEQSGLPLGLASEASFGPHPSLPLLAVGRKCWCSWTGIVGSRWWNSCWSGAPTTPRRCWNPVMIPPTGCVVCTFPPME